MIKALYRKYQYFLNIFAVLMLLVITRLVDGLAWYPPSPDKVKNLLLDHFLQFISFLPFIFLLVYTYDWAMKKSSKALIYSFITLYSVFAPLFVLLSTSWLEKTILKAHALPVTFKLILQYTPGATIVMLLLTATYFITYFKCQSEREREFAHKAETLVKDVQIKMFRYQINPHFLFNVLNSIYTLIDENTGKAKKLVLDMSDYYRYTLTKQNECVTIEREIESIVKYLEIQKTRFEDNFKYEILADESVKAVLIPSFLIHLLIENAIKYGKITSKQKLLVNLTVKQIKNSLVIRVSNTGKLLELCANNEKAPDGTSNGIDNLKGRLALYFGDNYSFSLEEKDEWVNATIEISNIFNQ
ncbi:MAG: sensor histidine kinase [Bacteroidales bacterium]